MSLAAVHAISPFSFLTAQQVRFGRGTADAVVSDVVAFGNRVLLVRGRSVRWVDTFSDRLAGSGCTVEQITVTQEPTIADVETATFMGREARADVVVAVGGGAVIDLGKAAAAMIPASGTLMDHLEGVGGGQPLQHDPLPFIALPTTAGTGSEVTKNAVVAVPEAGRKVSLRDDRMLPRIAVVDPGLMDRTPIDVTLASGLDAVTQVIEPYLSSRANPLTDALCRAAIPAGLIALATLAKGENSAARDNMAYVSLIGGIALANAGLGAVHGLAGVIGGRFGVPHGLICGRLLGPVLCQNRDFARQVNGDLRRYDEIARWIGEAFDVRPDNGFEALSEILDEYDLQRLGRWVGPDADLGAVVRDALASSSMKGNPYPLSTEALNSALCEAL